MPELLLELFSEEIPASMQAGAADDLLRLTTSALLEQGLIHGAARAFAGPRRLTVSIDGLPGMAPDRREERRGPRLGAPDSAVEGFLRSAGVTRDQLRVEKMDKGEFYLATIERRGRATPLIVAEIVPAIIRDFPWPKSMVWGEGTLRWVRPLKSILCCFDGERVAFEIDGIRSSDATLGHRTLGPAKITARRFEDYVQKLESASVIVDAAARRQIIEQEARTLAFGRHLEVIEDKALADEVSGLVEWPVVLMGGFDSGFLDVPPEVLTTTMRTNQKYFALRDPKTGRLAPYFLVVANLAADDGGAAIIAGNEKVLRARLADARFFWNQDRKRSLESRLPQLEQIVFHAKLGTLRERAGRIAELAVQIGGAPEADLRRAGTLAKADLVTGMVGEFPELQGVMGRYYALHDGIQPAVADAIRDHYSPVGPSDAVPTAAVSIAVALAEKLDTLIGFFGIDEKPTGSKDPYALRRAALGVIRIILENEIDLPLRDKLESGASRYRKGFKPESVRDEVLAFLADRLKVYLKDRGISHDLIAAVFGLGNQDNLLEMVQRARALKAFLDTEDGANLLVAYRRAGNILRIEGRGAAEFNDHPNVRQFTQDEERNLFAQLQRNVGSIRRSLTDRDFETAMRLLAQLREPVDRFFEKVTVNADDPELRRNRLRLLNQVCYPMNIIADFSAIESTRAS